MKTVAMASLRRQRRRSCEHKVRFDESSEAFRALTRWGFFVEDHSMHVYKCKFCKGYHIGH